jgi:hypothetical protein
VQVAFKIPHLYDFVIELCRQQATAMLNHEHVNIRNIGQGQPLHRGYIRLFVTLSVTEVGSNQKCFYKKPSLSLVEQNVFSLVTGENSTVYRKYSLHFLLIWLWKWREKAM